MTDQGNHGEETTTVEWIKAVFIVVLAAIVVVLGLVWFAFTFLVQSCCAYPSPAL